MNANKSLETILKSIPENVKLIAVSKTRSVEEIQAMYDAGQRDFGENKVQELTQKYPVLPKDIRWHQIGHLQKNKVKYIAPFIDLIHSVDSEELLQTINKEAKKNSRVISVLLQIKIAQEETKYGLFFDEALKLLKEKESGKFEHIEIRGCMGMASFTNNINQINEEFSSLNNFYVSHQKEFDLTILSMGMSGDYPIAIECGSTMVRIGSKLFGPRDYTH